MSVTSEQSLELSETLRPVHKKKQKRPGNIYVGLQALKLI
jgi:hypothetical protein